MQDQSQSGLASDAFNPARNRFISKQLQYAIEDVASLFTHAKLWSHLSWVDIKRRYIGSYLGPFWITMSMSIFILAFGLIYGRLLHQPLNEYIPFLTCGILIWTYISSTLCDSCEMFVGAKSYIYQIKLPYMLYLYRVVCRNVIIFLHNAVVYALVMIYFHVKPTIYLLLFIPGFLLVTANLIAVSMLTGLIGTRFRDIPPVITSIIQVVFFVSPITWMPHLIGHGSRIIKYNPITYFLDIVRQPLLGHAPSLHSFEICFLLTLFTLAISFPCFVAKRREIAFWL